MKRIILISTLLILSMPAVAGVYRWEDTKGGVHYSDVPQPGSVPVDIGQNTSTVLVNPVVNPAVNSTVNPAAQASVSANTSTIPDAKQETTQSYQALAISQPQAEATLRDGLGQVTVTVNLTPALQSGDQIAVLLDGKIAGQSSSNSVTLTNVDRGAHQLQAQVLSADKKVLLTSSSITFYMQRPIAKH